MNKKWLHMYIYIYITYVFAMLLPISLIVFGNMTWCCQKYPVMKQYGISEEYFGENPVMKHGLMTNSMYPLVI